MANASRDNNGVPIALAVSNADGATLLRLYADPTTHRLSMNDGTTGSNLSSNTDARRDNNFVTGVEAVSSVDGISKVPLYTDSSTNKLLVNRF